MPERKFALSIARKLRLHKGLTHMADISSRTLQGIERRANASPNTFKCITSVLETDFENLWKEQEMPTEEQPKMPWLSAEVKDVMEYISDIKAFYIHLFASVVVKISAAARSMLEETRALEKRQADANIANAAIDKRLETGRLDSQRLEETLSAKATEAA